MHTLNDCIHKIILLILSIAEKSTSSVDMIEMAAQAVDLHSSLDTFHVTMVVSSVYKQDQTFMFLLFHKLHAKKRY